MQNVQYFFTTLQIYQKSPFKPLNKPNQVIKGDLKFQSAGVRPTQLTDSQNHKSKKETT